MRIVHDIECLPNFFSIAIVDYDSDREWSFEISERRNDIDRIVEFYKDVKIAIGFNSVHYDDIVINYLFKNYKKLKSLSYLEVTKQLKTISDYVVNDRYEDYKQYKYNIRYTALDLYLYWSKLLRVSKKLSLKSIAVGMNWKLIKEFPLKHTDNIKLEQIDEFLKYNFNDSYVTKELANRLKDDINLRVNVEKEYGVNCISKDAVKIAQDLFLKMWNKTKEEVQQSPKSTIQINKILYPFEFEKTNDEKYKNGFISDYYWLLEELKSKTVSSTNEINYSVLTKNPNGTLLKSDYGSGGVHALTDKTVYETTEDVLIITSDFGSLYPSLFCNIPNYVEEYSLKLFGQLDEQFRNLYNNIRLERLKAKKEGNKLKAEVFKLMLNSSYGCLNNEYSYMYNPEIALSICLNGQLILSDLANEARKIGVSIISKNTRTLVF
jgi:hypothetical protein